MDIIPSFLQLNNRLNHDRGNVMTLHMSPGDAQADYYLYTGVAHNGITAAYVDASHDFGSVFHDLACIATYLPSVVLIILDDYGTEEGVRREALAARD